MDLSAFAQIWILFALASAFFHASRLAVTKRLSPSFSARALTFYVNLASLAVTLPLILWYHDFPLHQPAYVLAVLCGGVLSGLGGWALNAALHRSEVSLVGPLMTLTPGLAIAIEWLLTGALPAPLGWLGVGLLILGGYTLGIDERGIRWHRPLRTPGRRLALLAAACFAAASVFGRIGIQLSDPLSFAVMVAMVNPLVLLVVFGLQDRRFYAELTGATALRELRPLLLLGVLFALMRIADQIALSLALASYVMAVKRSAGIFSVLLGRWLFAEPYPRTRLLGASIMLLGVLVLTLG
ncbi:MULTISPECIES: EamA family transporter [unclassified Marichromatium]|uniref:EamA family transporter n=1 Tax=unclassified Marichromatium TaxID=2618417 RepID=UPI000F3B4D6B|nr:MULTISPECIES: EamA family transporter [unclassified Marichromatium]RNE88936.1 EamA family transporter [Marichromatium sp. AB31]RNE89698.1 EamA family transporter [Marichromatium sp. AB32]